MTQFIDLDGLTIHCIEGNPDKIAYILYPMEVLAEWAQWAAGHYNTSIVCITGIDWDNALSPWPAEGQPPGSPDFKGESSLFLSRLEQQIVPKAEKAMGIIAPQRSLVGVSMSGLFTMWQRFVSDMFPTIATLSGSFWYPGFADWVCSQKQTSGKTRAVYMSLGSKESQSPVKAFKSVADDTSRILHHLQQLDIKCHFDSVPGNHYANPLPRLDLAFKFMATL